jgi:signal transduction histidine kinase
MATLNTLAWVLAAVGSTTTLLVAAALAGVVHRTLKPVARLAAEIDAIREDELDTRLGVAAAPKELLPVVHRLNGLLDRLQGAFEREKSFTADAAHELRTPLAGLRSTLEVSLSRPRATDAYRQAMQKCLAICQRTQSILETLLRLARLQAATPAGASETVQVARLLSDGWQTWADVACQRRLDVQWHVDDSLQVRTDANRLAIVIDNLFANTVAHTDEGGRVRIETATSDNRPTIRITNSGSRLDSERVGRVFDPFWRGDTARSDTGTHAGLGLSLCKRLADSLGCTISATSTPGGEFSVCLRFPTPRTLITGHSEPEDPSLLQDEPARRRS